MRIGISRTAGVGFAVAGAMVMGLLLPGAAGAAPNNKNTGTLNVSCGPPIGDVQLTFNARNSSVSAFVNGEVAVIKHAGFVGQTTFAVEGGPTFTLPEEEDTLGGQGQGRGYQDKLVTCTMPVSFEEEFTLDAEGAAFFGEQAGIDLTPYIGATVHASLTGTFTAQVIVPGS
jgi:hypothetical protein